MRIIFSIILSFFLSIGCFSSVLAQNDVFFTTNPTISADGRTIVFSYESDLWKVSSSGGQAVRLTGMDGEEIVPKISPDGKWIAFSSNQYGNNDVYLMPINGGEIKQLTFHQANDQVESWNWDSDEIFIRSDRYNRTSVYSLSIKGGTPKRLFSHYHNTVHNLVKHPDENTYYFSESWESFIFPQRKKYRGPYNPDIKSYNTDSQVFYKLTEWKGKDLWPTLDRNGTLYFASDEANGEYNLYTLNGNQKIQLTNFNTSVFYPQVSADGETIVFERDYQIYTYHVSAQESKKVPIRILKNNTLAKEQSFNVEDEVSHFDVSPDRNKLAFTSRGELFVSDIEGKFIRKIETDPMGRVLEVKWFSDNKTLIFNRTVSGYQNLFTISADGSGSEKQVTSSTENNRALEMNSDRSMALYLSGRNELRLLDLKTLESETIVNDEFWGFQNQQSRFSPNDEYILYTARRDFEHDIFTYHIDTGEIMNLTETGVSESDPFWSPDGRYIYFSSSRTQPSYPRGGGETDIYQMALDVYDEPFKSDKFAELFEEEEDTADEEAEKEEAEKEEVNISINPQGLMKRLTVIGERFGSQYSPFVLQDGDKNMILYGSNHDEGNSALYVTTIQPFERPETKKIEGIDFAGNIQNVDGKLYGLSRGTVYEIDPSAAKATKIETSHEFKRNLRDEFDQMFEELWANLEENFYNETFHNVDWQRMHDRYKEFLPYVNNRNDLSRLMNDMLGELNSSHMGFSTSGDEDEEFYSTVSISTGLLFDESAPYRVRHVIKHGPADIADKDIRPGDILTAVDGKSIDPDANREMYFNSPSMPEEISLTFKRGNDTITAKIHPESYFSIRNDLYDEWVDQKQKMVDEESDERVAYIHMKNMGGGELENFLIEMTSEAYQRDGLILDLRYNTGGNVHNDVLQFLTQRPYLQWKYRNGDFATQPNFTPAAKPIILLINEQSLSDAEVTAAGFKELDLGTVVGTETYRWIIFTSGKGLVDGSFYRLPAWGVYSLDGQYNLERTGVFPDIEVNNTFKDRLLGRDPQLSRAIQLALDQLEN
ncbi:S41 family peptidase [Gracilimonas sp. Q87]|uniref:S41 family peptidase n=1 Tax=Gracilimonas sp. Q87 TaxID=3384766 RepID=UPI003983F7BC